MIATAFGKALAAGLAAAVLASAAPTAAADWRQQFKEVRIGILSSENEKDHSQRYGKFVAYLERESGVKVRTFWANAYSGVIQALASDQIEFAFLGSSAYAAAWAETKGGVDPLVSRLNKDGSTGYFSVVAVRCDSGYKTVDDLKGKILAFADPNSTSGYQVPYFNLRKQGYAPETFFKSTPYSGAHETGVLGVVNGQYDAAATFINNEVAGVPQRMVGKNMIKKGEICWIWKSPEITNGPFTARKNLPPEMRKTFADLLFDVPKKDPEAFALMTGNPTQTGWVRVDHERYAWIVEMRDELRKLRRQRGS